MSDDRVPRRIIIERVGRLQRFTIENFDGDVLDTSLSSSRWFVWRMAKSSWRSLMRQHRKSLMAAMPPPPLTKGLVPGRGKAPTLPPPPAARPPS